MAFFQHPQALVESKQIGDGTRVWAFAHVLPGAVIGRDCNVCDHVFVENEVVVGDRVTIKCGVQLWDGVSLEDDVFIGPNVTFTNDPFPRSRQHLGAYPKTIVRKGASIGANSTILPGLTIGAGAMIGAGSVVTRSVPPNAVVVGNPARVVRFVSDVKAPPPAAPTGMEGARTALEVGGAELVRVPLIGDPRGHLMVREAGKGLPFVPQRCFFVFDVPPGAVRGEHAHRRCQQLLVCVRGSVTALVDDGARRQEIRLDDPTLGLYMPPMLWGTQYDYSPDAMLVVFASRGYEVDDYVREYSDFLNERASARPAGR